MVDSEKDEKIICENCKCECTQAPVIWSVPHWFCSTKCEREFYKKYEDVIVNGQLITRLRESTCEMIINGRLQKNIGKQ